jgi:type II secretory pathway component GspD/PulD (secretin)
MQMRKPLLGLVLGVSCAFGVGDEPVANAQSAQLVENVFFETDLRTALEDISAQTGANIVADPSVQGLVTATIEGLTIDDALDVLLAGTGFRVVERPNYYLVFNPDIRTDIFAEVTETEIFDLTTIPADRARDLLVDPLQRYVRADTENRRLIVTAPAGLLEIIRDDLAAIDTRRTEETVFVALTYASAPAARDLLPKRLHPYVRANAERNSLTITGPAEIREEAIELLRRIDRRLPPASVDTRDVYDTILVNLDHITAEAVMNLLPESLAEFVRADTVGNALSINAPPGVAHQILADIVEFDQPRQHIMLEARVVVLDTNALLNLGTEFQPPGLTAGANRIDGGGRTSEIALGYTSGRVFTNALTLTLNMLSENNQATIVASPQTLAQDGIESVIRVTTAEFFQILTENDTFIRSDLEEIETGTILRITPQVGRSGTLTLDMELEVSDVVARGEQNLPVVNRRTVENTVQIANGGTAAVAGLSDLRSTRAQAGIPGLRGIPFFGRNDEASSTTQQVAIFVTATLVGPDHHTFQTGGTRPPSLGVIEEEVFRSELAAALARRGI